MQLRFRTTVTTLLTVLSQADLLAVPALSQASTQEIRIAGSSTLAPIVERVAKQYRVYHPEVQFVLAGGGSAEGIAAVGSGRVQIGLASRALKDREIHDYPDLLPVRIGIDGIALVVHAENRVSEITTRKVKEVYSGQIVNWEALGGQAAPIVLMAPDEKHGTFDAFCTLFELDAKPKANTGIGKKLRFRQRGSDQYSACETSALDGNGPVLAALAEDPKGLACTSLGSALRSIAGGKPLKILAIDGVTPTTETVRDGTYTAQRPLLVITKGKPTAEIDLFFRYLASKAGQQIVEEMDCISLSRSE